MAKKSTKRSAAVAIAQTQKLEQNSVDDAKIASAESNAAVVVDSTLPLPKPVSQSIAMPAENDTPSVPATEGETTVKVKSEYPVSSSPGSSTSWPIHTDPNPRDHPPPSVDTRPRLHGDCPSRHHQ